MFRLFYTPVAMEVIRPKFNCLDGPANTFGNIVFLCIFAICLM